MYALISRVSGHLVDGVHRDKVAELGPETQRFFRVAIDGSRGGATNSCDNAYMKPTTQVLADKDPAAGIRARRVFVEEFDAEIGPMPDLRGERERLASLTWENFEVRRIAATCGAEIHGLDITRELPAPVVAEVREALLAYKVIFFRDQPLTPGQHLDFARSFGELEVHPFLPGNPDHPELVRFEKGMDTAGYENGWHHDVTWRAIPSMGAILHAIEVPEVGGDTLFSDMAAAYDGLEADMKERLEGLVAVHDFMFAFAKQVPEDKQAETRAQYPLVEHPVIRTHPETGRKLIYVNAYFTSHIKDMDPAESRQLLTYLTKRANFPEYQCRFRWEPDSVAFWDNRVVQHYAASDYWPQRRVMERASVVGDRPA